MGGVDTSNVYWRPWANVQHDNGGRFLDETLYLQGGVEEVVHGEPTVL